MQPKCLLLTPGGILACSSSRGKQVTGRSSPVCVFLTFCCWLRQAACDSSPEGEGKQATYFLFLPAHLHFEKQNNSSKWGWLSRELRPGQLSTASPHTCSHWHWTVVAAALAVSFILVGGELFFQCPVISKSKAQHSQTVYPQPSSTILH